MVHAHYNCWRCDENYTQFNQREGKPAKCPRCRATNYPGYEVILFILLKKKFC